MPDVERDGVRLHWEESGSGVPLLLVMGHRFSSRMWYPILPQLAADFRVIRFDNRGTGGSGWRQGESSLPAMARDAAAVLDAAGADSCHVFGVSMGGFIALELAMRFPDRVRSLILGCTGALTADKPRPPRPSYLQYWVPRRFYGALAKGRLYGPLTDREAIARDTAMLRAERFDPRGLVAQAVGIAGYATSLTEVGQVPHPALVLHGTHDRVIPFAWGQELAAALPAATFVPLEGAGHNFLVGAAEPTLAAVTALVRDVESQRE